MFMKRFKKQLKIFKKIVEVWLEQKNKVLNYLHSIEVIKINEKKQTILFENKEF